MNIFISVSGKKKKKKTHRRQVHVLGVPREDRAPHPEVEVGRRHAGDLRVVLAQRARQQRVEAAGVPPVDGRVGGVLQERGWGGRGGVACASGRARGGPAAGLIPQRSCHVGAVQRGLHRDRPPEAALARRQDLVVARRVGLCFRRRRQPLRCRQGGLLGLGQGLEVVAGGHGLLLDKERAVEAARARGVLPVCCCCWERKKREEGELKKTCRQSQGSLAFRL